MVRPSRPSPRGTYRRPALRSERVIQTVLGATTYNCLNGTCCDKPCNPGAPCPKPHQVTCK